MREKLTQDELKRLLSYCEQTGQFRWRVRTGYRVRPGMIAGSLTQTGYIRIGVNRQEYGGHRLAFLYMTGSLPAEEIDHINGVRSDNRWVNLRAVSHAENAKNLCIQKRNATGIVGVRWNKNRWEATIIFNGEYKHLGTFLDKNDAINARKAASEQYGFHPNHGRLPT